MKVRKFMSENDISFVSQASETGSDSRKLVEELSGKSMVPFLIDTDKGVSMNESGDIIEYLKKEYLT